MITGREKQSIKPHKILCSLKNYATSRREINKLKEIFNTKQRYNVDRLFGGVKVMKEILKQYAKHTKNEWEAFRYDKIKRKMFCKCFHAFEKMTTRKIYNKNSCETNR